MTDRSWPGTPVGLISGAHGVATLLPLPRVYVAVALSGIAVLALALPIPPTDFWFHLATGRLIIDSGAIPTTDVFSYTQPGAEFFNQSWLAQVSLYGLYRLGGLPGVLAGHAVLVVSAYGLLVWWCLRRSASHRVTALVMILAILPASVTNWSVRPQSLALPLFAAFFVLIEHYRCSTQDDAEVATPLWPLPLLMVLWVNVHGTFVLGFALLGLVLAAEALKRGWLGQPALTWRAWRRLLGWTAATAVAVLANPRGAEVAPYVVDLLRAPAVRGLVREWAPPTVASPTGAIFFVLAVAVFVVAIYAPARPDVTDILVIVAFFVLGLTAGRHGVWFAMVAAPFAVSGVTAFLPRPEQDDPGSWWMNITIITLLLVLVILALPWVKPHVLRGPSGALAAEGTPVAAVEALRDDPQRAVRLFHGNTYGSYLMWALPEQPVFIDPRIELYPLGQFHDYLSFARAQDMDHLVEKYDFDGALLDQHSEAPLIRALADEPDWALVYDDAHSAYYRNVER